MKLEALFKAENNNLVKLSDNSVISLDNLKIYNADNFNSNPITEAYFAIEVPWTKVELDDEVYNEELLAALRDALKAAEEKGLFCFIIPVVDKAFSTPEQMEAYTNAFNHTARRIKDCVSVIGLELPEAVLTAGIQNDFMEVLAKKHAQYLYFVKKESADKATQNGDFGIITY